MERPLQDDAAPLNHGDVPEVTPVAPASLSRAPDAARGDSLVTAESAAGAVGNASCSPTGVYEPIECREADSPRRAQGGRQLGRVEMRLRCEVNLLRRQVVVILVCLVVLIYGALIVFRNLAFYRYKVGERLRDAGHDLFPELPKSKEKLSDLPMYFYYVLLGTTLLSTLRPSAPGDAPRPYLANIGRRVLQVYCTGHVMRACTYLVTSVPGSADHCLPGADLDPPSSIGECFTRMSSVNGNCGDLIFSGHMLLMWMGMCFLWTYGAGAWGVERLGRAHVGILALGMAITIVQACMILAARHHYTVDVVVATYTTPLLWHFHNTTVLPSDFEPDLDAVHAQVEKEAGWPRWRHAVRWLMVAVIVLLSGLVLWTIMKGNLKAFTFGK
eukprot:TRINITY_DN8526_c0_g1_i1.p1 TRINITY_DN8526_c0_g1~~TRINITY_DN8526_c0_g1_i1.p1  ORF type:complete len:417 (+),score=135.90 TRINITY_DN8526_c0_g1_i1:94-1251(+)